MYPSHTHLVSVVCLLLAACATPQQSCMEAATRDIRTVDALIAETEANLARGFAVQTEVAAGSGVSFCAGGFGDVVGVSFCAPNRVRERQVPVAIDPEVEQQKLNDLRARRAELEEPSALAAAACQS